MMNKQSKEIALLIKRALREDGARRDITTRLTVPAKLTGTGVIIAKGRGILCGMVFAERVFKQLDPRIRLTIPHTDGYQYTRGEVILRVTGSVRTILAGERVALNFLSLLSGVSGLTHEFVKRTAGMPVHIMDTRKTTPLWREFEKYAVRVGGGQNHRSSLNDGILIKDNHLKAGRFSYKGSPDTDKIRVLFGRLRARMPRRPVEIEVENLREFEEIVRYRPNIIMLDNFTLRDLATAVRLRNERFPGVKLEASGGITLKNVRKVAQTGVDLISIGMLTHSPQAADFSLEIL